MIEGTQYGFYRCDTIEERDAYEFPVDLDVVVRVESSPAVTYVGRNGVFKSITGSGTGGYDGDPTTIVQDATHRFVSDEEKDEWDSKVSDDDSRLTDSRTPTAHDHDELYEPIKGTDDNYITDAEKIKVAAIDQVFTGTEKTKLGHITATQAVDLDDIETRVNNLDAAVVLKGTWDASAGTFPGGGTAQAGASYIVSVAGTVDSVSFSIGDRVIAITDNASTTTFSANWFKADYTDQVLSVVGLVGAISKAGLQTAIDVSGVNSGDQDLSSLALKATTITINGDSKDLSANRSWTITASLPEAVYTSNTITSDTTIPVDCSFIVRGRLKVNSGIRLKPASGASIMTI